MTRNLFLALLFTAAVLPSNAPLQADGPVTFTRFLVPIYTPDTPGAHGSLWQVRTWIYYAGTEEAVMVPRPFCFGITCPLAGALQPDWPAVPFQHLSGFPEPAILVHIDSRFASEAAFASRVRDLSMAADSAGTEVRVVPEGEMSTGPVYLLNVPASPKFRTTLRVYALPEVQDPEVEVRYFRQPDDQGSRLDTDVVLLRTDRVRLRTRRDGGELQLYPSIVEIGALDALPELAGEDAIWIEVVPITPHLRIWALLSVTNNETQQVTVVSPHW